MPNQRDIEYTMGLLRALGQASEEYLEESFGPNTQFVLMVVSAGDASKANIVTNCNDAQLEEALASQLEQLRSGFRGDLTRPLH